MPASDTNNTVSYYLDAHHRLLIALAVAAVAFFGFYTQTSAAELTLLVWIFFAMSLIVPQWIVILTAHPQQIIRIAKLQDSSRSFIFLFIISAAVVSLGAIVMLLRLPKQAANAHDITPVLLSLGSVMVSWWLVHTVFTLRYAHGYYDTTRDDGGPKPGGGLDFPGNEEPDYLDFVYFSFIIGMTFQVSDVEISSKKLRRLALVHSLISFVFNTAIVALSINIVSGLMGS